MIAYDLSCSSGHRFEGWFGSSHDFTDQQARGILSCPQCGSGEVRKAPMAPAVPKKGNQPLARKPHDSEETQLVTGGKMPRQMVEAMQKIAQIQAEALKQSEWVGDQFADASRAIHYGERAETPIHGKATRKEALDLLDEGIAVAPLLIPITPPDEVN